ncbi:MAG: TIGR04255 family protein [Deltaproteobacteria bacterium]|nr:TIGR04255 family protein [Deltaproteobacteria bacterium]
MTTERPLPKFANPPIVETVLGFEFSPIRWSVPHFGLFWSEIRSQYPHHEVQPPLNSLIERFGNDRISPNLQIQFLQHPLVRCWFVDPSNRRLIQIQQDRFIQNWRKQGPEDQYPHYEQIWPGFEKEWARFCAFSEREELGQPQVTQCEVTYVNQIERGAAWSSLNDLGDVVTFWKSTPASSYLPAPEAVLAKIAFVIPRLAARLHVELQHALRTPDLTEVLQLSITVRGQPKSGSSADLNEWMGLAREVVVRSFVDLTTPRMHEIWKRSA